MKDMRTRSLAFRDARFFPLGEGIAERSTGKSSRHPFRITLSHKLLVQTDDQACCEQAAAQPKKWLGEDMSLFLLSFSAFFTAFYLFIF
ncbi:hypothetical protein AB1K62_04905 [Parasphingorhabdus sp. JC815]|uniref:hypothetical protein n=1 Tax=Parasphingorhabdus sp. JC815 TaxID=3232140 RepID=UPI0034576211